MKLTTLLIVVCFGLLAFAIFSVVTTINNKDIGTFEFNGVKVSAQDYKAIQEKFENYRDVPICNLDSGKCILLTKLPND